MSKNLGCFISEEFRRQLENATSQTHLTVIATIRESSEVTEAVKMAGKGYRRSSPEERQAITEAETRMMEPVSKYLEGLGVRYSSMRAIHVVTAQMTPQQILDFVKQPYVAIVCLDTKVVLID
ncbi:MAG: hypothetical protein AABX54_05780 [Nanoarchaeota archaeon]